MLALLAFLGGFFGQDGGFFPSNSHIAPIILLVFCVLSWFFHFLAKFLVDLAVKMWYIPVG
jgi:hypothetical protein